MTERFASLTAPALRVREAVEYGTMDEFDGYDHAYLNIQDGNLEIVSAVPGESASTYANFSDEGFFNQIVVDEIVEGEAEALIDIDTFLFYLDNAETEGSVTVEFYGEEGNRLASYVEIKGSLTSSVYIPNSSKILEQIPLWLSDAFTEDGNYQPGEKSLETEVETDIQNLQRIESIVDSDQVRGVNEYPVVAEDGELVLNVEDENSRSSISGSLEAEVEGPDFANTYQTGFKNAVWSLTGNVTLRTSPGGAPLALTQEFDGGTVRHILGHTGTV